MNAKSEKAHTKLETSSGFHNDRTGSLTPAERGALARCEVVISAHMSAFLAVGKALLLIQDKKLYRGEYETFEEYCRVRWDMTRTHAYRLRNAAEVCTLLSPIGDIPLPENEAQVRPLTLLPKEKVPIAWKKAVEKSKGGKITASIVSEVVKSLKPLNNAGGNASQWEQDVKHFLNLALNALSKKELEKALHDVDQARIRLDLEIQKQHWPKTVDEE